MIKWTNEMIEDLKTMKRGEFCEKYKISYNTAKAKLDKLNESTVEIKEKECKKEDSQSETFNSNVLKIIPSVILDIDKLIKQGSTFYIQESKNKLSTYDKMVSDLEHTLECNYDMNDEEYINISRNIGIIRRKRRLHKNEIELLENNKVDCQNFIKFIQTIKDFSSKVDNRIYHTRVLKEEIGIKIITSENNSRIKELENAVNGGDSLVSKLMELEKANLKFRRKECRDKGEIVAIDRLKPNWKDMFNSLDDITKKGILDEAYSKYNDIDLKEVKDFRVWQEILPQLLVDKKYFLRGE